METSKTDTEGGDPHSCLPGQRHIYTHKYTVYNGLWFCQMADASSFDAMKSEIPANMKTLSEI